MNALDCILTRVSSPKLIEPGPDQSQLETILKAGFRAPDHGALKPYHFYIANGDSRKLLSEIMVKTSDDENAKPEKIKNMPFRAPLVIIATAKIVKNHPKAPREEQLLCVGAAIQNMWLACHAMGYGAIWRSGRFAYNQAFQNELGLEQNEEIVGFLYIGSKEKADRPVPEVDATQHVTYL